MDTNFFMHSLLGGALIGLSATFLLLFNGRVTGISGILGGALGPQSIDGIWRWTFLAGLVAGGVLVHILKPELFLNVSNRDLPTVIAAGFLVGYGTLLGSGCTSGHGICGISRFSLRSLVATTTFMLFGFLTVQALRFLLGGYS